MSLTVIYFSYNTIKYRWGFKYMDMALIVKPASIFLQIKLEKKCSVYIKTLF